MRKLAAAAAAVMMAVSPCLAADIPAFQDNGARRSGAVAAAYFKVPLGGGGGKAQKGHGGLRLSMTHDYRGAGAQTARVASADALDLRLVGEKKPAFYVAGQKLDDESKRSNLGPVGSAVTIVIVAAALVAGFYLARAIDDSGEE